MKFPRSEFPKFVFSFLFVVGLSGVLLPNASASSKHHHSSNRQADSTPGKFDYYLLTLSWAPEFCATHTSNASSSECDPKRHYGFVVHGMWPENKDGSYPESCAPAQPVSQAIVQQMLPIMPARGLIQHEWATHGTCSGLSSSDYFGDIQKAFRAVQIPSEFRSTSGEASDAPSAIEQKFAAANHVQPNFFRVSCSGGEFVAVEVCLSKDLQMIACAPSLRDCRSSQVEIKPIP